MSSEDQSFPPAWGFNLDLSGLLGVDENQLLPFQDFLGVGGEGTGAALMQDQQQQQQQTLIGDPALLEATDSLDSLMSLDDGFLAQQFGFEGLGEMLGDAPGSPGNFYPGVQMPATMSLEFGNDPLISASPPSSIPNHHLSISSLDSMQTTDSTITTALPPGETAEGNRSAPPPPRKQRKTSSGLTTADGRPIAKPNTRRKACEPCRARKLRCDGIRPHCTTCTKSTAGASQCLYFGEKQVPVQDTAVAPAPTNGKKSTNIGKDVGNRKRRGPAEVKALEDRVNALEAMLAAAMSDRSSKSPTERPVPSPEANGKDPMQTTSETWPTEGFFDTIGGSPLLPNGSPSASTTPREATESLGNLLSGASIMNTETALTTELRSFESAPPDLPIIKAAVTKTWFCDFVMSFKEKLTVEALEDHKKKEQLPLDVLPGLNTLGVRRDLVDMYFDNKAAHAPFDFLHRATFVAGLEMESPMLLFALYSVVASTTYSKPTRNSAPFFYARARKLISMHLENPTLSGLQGLTLLCSSSMSQGLMAAGWMYLGMACRMALFLRLDVDPEGLGLRWADAESRRRLWWAIVSLDKVKSSVTGRSPFLNQPDPPLVQYPCPDAIWDAADTDGNLPAHLTGMRFDSLTADYMKFYPIYARAIEYNRLALKDGVKLDEVCPTATVLEAEIHSWFRNLPSTVHHVPDPEAVYTFSNIDPTKINYQAVTCYMLYKCALCLVRRPRIVSALLSPIRTPQVIEAISTATAVADDVAAMSVRLVERSGEESNGPAIHADSVSFVTGLGVLEAAFIHIVGSTVARSAQDLKRFEEHQASFRDLQKLLKALGRRAPPARLMGDVAKVINDQLLDDTYPDRGSRSGCDPGHRQNQQQGRQSSSSSSSHAAPSPRGSGSSTDSHSEAQPPSTPVSHWGLDGSDCRPPLLDDEGSPDGRGPEEVIGFAPCGTPYTSKEHDQWVRDMVSGVCSETVGNIVKELAVPIQAGDTLADLAKRGPLHFSDQ
ncbi:hypothetical protein HKX48_007094 [Thoreauomyces humboldtii]|nr:hypothetical protein HKX48_007094 [Thoreauomyces humboldtii]